MTRQELITVIDDVQSAETRLRHVVQSKTICGIPETVVAAEVLEALAPLVATYQAVCTERQHRTPTDPWPAGTVIWTMLDGPHYGLVEQCFEDVVLVHSVDGVKAYPRAMVVWMSAPSPVTTAFLAVS